MGFVCGSMLLRMHEVNMVGNCLGKWLLMVWCVFRKVVWLFSWWWVMVWVIMSRGVSLLLLWLSNAKCCFVLLMSIVFLFCRVLVMSGRGLVFLVVSVVGWNCTNFRSCSTVLVRAVSVCLLVVVSRGFVVVVMCIGVWLFWFCVVFMCLLIIVLRVFGCLIWLLLWLVLVVSVRLVSWLAFRLFLL